MTLTHHRGTHEIGGSCVEIKTDKAKILIDLGMPLDFERHTADEQEQIHRDVGEWCRGVDAVFLSHAHADHYGFLNLLPKETPVYATEESFAMLAIDSVFGIDPTTHLTRCAMQSYTTYTVGDILITCYPVDHSAFGACALLIEYDGKRVLYSGDIRLHGVKGVLYKRLPQSVDYLLLEGTNISRSSHNPTERHIERLFIETFNEAPQRLHLVWCSSKNIDRICALYRACLQSSKTLLVDPYVAYVLEQTKRLNHKIPSVTTSDRIKVYFPPYLTSRLIDKDKERYIYSLMPAKNKVSYEQISANPGGYVMVVRPSMLDYLTKIKTTRIALIRSIWRGYWDEPSTAAFRTWAEQSCEEIKDIHSSGHADVGSLRRIVAHIQPKNIVPIHTEQPDKFGDLFPTANVCYLEDNVVVAID